MKTIVIVLALVIVGALLVVVLFRPQESAAPTDTNGFIGPTGDPYVKGPQGLPPQ
ncbi:MAG: hypothetical protein AAB407_00920 [Patescibacteria group bacterium]